MCLYVVSSSLFLFEDRIHEADTYLQSFRYADCDYCKVGWFGTSARYPGTRNGVPPLNSAVAKYNFLLVDAPDWQEDGDKRICRKCCDEVEEERSRLRQSGASDADVVAVRPQLNTDMNDMDIGDTYEELDALTFFEEEILAPVQPMVRVYTLYGTGLTEMRGHVASWMQSGPQFVREIPARAHELNLLLVRRFPRDPNRKQRVPFIASPARLQAALDRIEGKLDSDEHVGLRYHRIVVNRENLVDYAEGQEPKGLQVQIVDQREDIVFDQSLF